MATHGSDNSTRPRRVAWAFIPGTVFLRTLLAAVGVDGGPIFQILAMENLGLTPRQLGVAFGVGVVSLPLQIAAARLPLRYARRNARLFFVMLSMQCFVLSGLLAAGASGTMAMVALVVTVIGEIGVSVLHAPSWQPLIAVSLSGVQRQRLNSLWPAVARGVLAGCLVLFTSWNVRGRSVVLGVCGLSALISAACLSALPSPAAPRTVPEKSKGTLGNAPRIMSGRTRSSPFTLARDLPWGLLTAAGAVNLAALPLWLGYLKTSLYPHADLGRVGAVQTIASLAALLAWRATDGDLTYRGRLAASALVVAGAVTLLLAGPVDTVLEAATVYGITVVSAFSTTVINVVILEELHRRTPSGATVKTFTMLDVVESTSLQIGLFVAGFLIDPATTVPYRVFLLCTSAAAAVTTFTLPPNRRR